MPGNLYELAPEPPSKLGIYRVLSSLAGVRVSPIALGGMSLGDKWADLGFGEMNRESSYKLLDAYYELGGNFIDTANCYQDGSSEEIIGEWMERRNNRNEIVVATKYSSNSHRSGRAIKANYTGNNLKSLNVSVTESLKRLRTTYIDILYIHWWDFETSIQEVMNGLHTLVLQGKVLYLGVSDAPAWVVSQANMYAQMAGKTPFSIYQGRWSVLDRSFERDIIPMARSLGLALAPWDVLRSGKLRTDAEEEEREKSGEKGRSIMNMQWKRNADEKAMSAALEKVANELGTENIRAVAIAYVMQKLPYVFPILGGRKIEQLTANLEALDITLSAEHFAALESVLPFDIGFPTNIMGDGSSYNVDMLSSARMAKVPRMSPIVPTPGPQTTKVTLDNV